MATATSSGRMSFKELDLGSSRPFHAESSDNVLQHGQSPRLNSPGPLPLPSFVFPARAPSPPVVAAPRSAPASFSRASGRRPLSAIEIRSQSRERTTADSETLPAFSFGSPSPVSPNPIPPRPSSSMHQRNVSEFIGGDGKTGNGAGLMSTSPTKSDGALPAPSSAFGPPGGRRGHAHRRSAAISVSDLTFILKPNASNTRGGSAPSSPSAVQDNHPTAASLDAAIQPAMPLNDLAADPEPSPKVFKNTRVGFSDEVSIIPRPLSMVSSDSSSTVRPGHSVSNSISSIVSAGTSSPSSKDQRGTPSAYRMSDTRPRTAEPILDRDQLDAPENVPKRRGSLPLLADVVSGSAPSTPRSAKKWSFFGHETASGESSPKSRPTSAASSAKESRKAESAPSSPELIASSIPIRSTEPSSSRRSSISRKPSKNKKKVRSWAGSILSRKSRQRKQKLSRRSPTPPLRGYTPADQNNPFDFNESERPMVRPEIQTDFTNWKPRKLPPQEESMSPIIDLDAALGPFNTPSSFGDDWDMSQKNGKRKRAMHSAAGLGGFTGPGMHYHRRAESAPEFENPRFGLHRLGSSSTMGMEDVFEEDEDEEWEDAKVSSDKESSSKAGDVDDEDEAGLGIDIKVVDSDGMDSENPMDFDDAAFQRGVKRKGSGLSEGDRRNMSSAKSAHSSTSLVDESIEEESSPIEIADDSLPPRPGSRAQSSDSTATPPFRPRPAKELAPVDIQQFSLQPYPTPTSPRSASQGSFPSPRSPFSYDTQRISTAPSSVTDENGFQSLLMGEPGPELRLSVDDAYGAPSLISNNSTMTRDSSGNFPQFRDGQRSASMSSAAVTRKRSSMASLSRLISSSHGEKSKLSIESRAPSVMEGEKKEKTSKGKRISRLMQFWKPTKESTSTP